MNVAEVSEGGAGLSRVRTGRVFEIREFTLQDGPGVRSTVFFKGCPLRCAWCHNPEGQAFAKESLVGRNGVSRVCGMDWTVPALADELLTNADIMEQSGGGITFSGGEPLAQAPFLLDLMAAIRSDPRARGITLAIETSGAVAPDVYRAVVSQLDFVYQDLKLADAESFSAWTGGRLDLVRENVATLRRLGVSHVFRTPIIPGVNDSPAARAAILDWAAGDEIEFLPYNAAAPAKYPLLGRCYFMKGVHDEKERQH